MYSEAIKENLKLCLVHERRQRRPQTAQARMNWLVPRDSPIGTNRPTLVIVGIGNGG
jgi:hypothetical protein